MFFKISIARLRRAGNCYADKLATQVVLKPTENYKRSLNNVGEKIQNETNDLIEAVETILNIFKEPDNPSTVSAVDDSGACAYASLDTLIRGVS